MMLEFDSTGNLPPGIHTATWQQFVDRFGWNFHRQRLISGLRNALVNLAASGCKRIYIDGSFVTSKEMPNDYDVLWDPFDVDPRLLDPIFLRFDNHRASQKLRYLGEFFPSTMTEIGAGTTFFQFFQIDKNTGGRKGMVMMDLPQFGGTKYDKE